MHYSRYEETIKRKGFYKTLRQAEFEKDHPEMSEIYAHLDEFQDPHALLSEKEKEKKKGKSEDSIAKYDFLFS